MTNNNLINILDLLHLFMKLVWKNIVKFFNLMQIVQTLMQN